MATLCPYSKTESGHVTVLRINDQILVRVIVDGEPHIHILRNPAYDPKKQVPGIGQVMVNGTDSPEDVFRKIDAQP